MKHNAARYVSECDTCRKVKTDYMKTGGLLQLLSISRVEVERYKHGLHCGFTSDGPQV
jgi:hypothetical protein